MSRQFQGIHRYPALKLQGGNLVAVEEMISEETPLTIYLNNKELITVLCSPVDRNYLALGFLVSEGLIGSIKDLTLFKVDNGWGQVWAEVINNPANSGRINLKSSLTAFCGRSRAEFVFASDIRVTTPHSSKLCLSGNEINSYVRMLEEASATHEITSGVHSGAIIADGKLMHYAEDIGRHNVFYKLYGKSLEAEIELADKLIVFSGRVSSEILLRVSKMGASIIIARSVPSSLAIDMANKLGITLIGAAKGDWFVAYTHTDRVKL